MKLREIISRLERRIPKSWAEEWDNPGLACGDYDAEISVVGTALDATEAAVAECAERGAGMLFTHHPLFFRPARSVTSETLVGRIITAAIRNGVAIYSAHTNWDSSPEGVNFILAEKLGLLNAKPLFPADGLWRAAVGDLPQTATPQELARILHEKAHITHPMVYGAPDRQIKKLAVGGGACKEFWTDALKAEADAFICSDISYHFREEALCAGLVIGDVDHGEMERNSIPRLSEITAEETGLSVFTVRHAGPAAYTV